MTFDELPQRLGGDPIRPFMVAYGLGVDSTAMLVALARRYRAGAVECRPDAILFADVGDEKPPTYAYLPVMQEYLARVGFPQVHVVRYEPKFAKYHTLYENCIVNKTLPSLAFGYKKCSLKFKRQPQDKWTRHWDMAQLAWKAGLTVIKAIGYDAGPKDARRAHIQDDKQYHYWYPLAELGWVREQCMEEIRKEGLPVPVKSACFFCPSMKPDEVIELCREHPELGWKIIEMETNAAPNNTHRRALAMRHARKTREHIGVYPTARPSCRGWRTRRAWSRRRLG